MISSRYAITVIGVVGLALIPTVIHTYIGFRSSDGRVTSVISETLADLNSMATDRKETWVRKKFNSNDWIERRYKVNGAENLLLFVARSFDPKRLYHHPEIALVQGVDLRDHGTERFPNYPEIPVHLLRNDRPNNTGLAVYSLLYEGVGIDNPYLFQLRNAWMSLFRGQRPMTLFFVYDPDSSINVSPEKARATQLLFEAIQSFLSQTPQTLT